MGEIDTVLQPGQLEMLRASYRDEDAIQILSSGIPGLDERTAEYISAIRRAFYQSSPMDPKDRERCLIAVLASRDAGLNLAIHIYVGLMEGLSPQEIADIIFLGGVYTGVDHISDGLAAEKRTLTVLAQIAAPPRLCTVLQVMQALHDAFTSPPPTLR
jgi:alkylhydroperoxidase/carboxymuconolactone decarboxylase family protein YurZ